MDAGRLQPLFPLWRYRPPPPTACGPALRAFSWAEGSADLQGALV